MVNNLPGIWVQSLGWEDLLEKAITTHSSILAWEIPWTEELGGLQSMGLQRVGHDLMTKQEQQYFLAVNLVFLRINTITIVYLYINLPYKL